MEVTCKIALLKNICSLALLMWFTEMNSTIISIRTITQNLSDIYLTALWPLSIIVLILRHHPKCWQESLSLWEFYSGFNIAILYIMLILSIYSA